jgi:hypothetical protein
VRLFFIDYYQDDKSQRQIGDVPVDDNGRFWLPDVEIRQVRDRHAALVLVVQSPGKATATSRWIDHEQARGQTFDFTLSPSATMQGRITDAEGRPISGAIVSTGCNLMKPVPGICAAVTDAAGRYEISDLRPFDLVNQKPQPAGNGTFTMFGESRAQVQHPDYARLPFEYTKIPSTVDATIHRIAEVGGQIVLGDNGQPANGAQLEFYNDLVSADYWTRTVTDDNGRYKMATLPPGKYRLTAKVNGRPNLFCLNVPLHAGKNTLDLRMEKGGKINGHVIEVNTGKPPKLGKDQKMDISTNDGGFWHAGMNSADIQPDGTFTLLVPAGRNHLGMYLGPNWRGVNTDELLENGVVVAEGQILELEIRVEPQIQERK